MVPDSDPEPSRKEVVSELDTWLDAAWDPSLTPREWWARLADKRWTAVALPVPCGGRGWSHELARAVANTLAQRGALGAPEGIGLMLAAPTIAAFGDPEQVGALLPRILRGIDGWCQLFSEPDAGSDLAGLTTRARRVDGGWAIDGAKVWTSQAHHADWGMLLARTDPSKPKHAGLTWFALDMDQPGVRVRPLREMTGDALFNEVELAGAFVPDHRVIGAVDDGWIVAMTTLAAERESVGTGLTAPPAAMPGSRAGHLDRPIAELLTEHRGTSAVVVDQELFAAIRSLLDQRAEADATLRHPVVHLWALLEQHRLLQVRCAHSNVPGGPNLEKLGAAELYRCASRVANLVAGPDAMLVGNDGPADGLVGRLTLFAPAFAIAGGSDQIQRNILGERVLGLPREPGPSSSTPFNQLPRNGLRRG